MQPEMEIPNKQDNIEMLSNLEILKVSYHFPYFRMTGKNWEFVSNAPWRLIKHRQLLTGDTDFDIGIFEKNLVHAEIVSFEETSKTCSGNLAIYLSDETIIEFFKDKRSNEWQMNLNGKIYMGKYI